MLAEFMYERRLISNAHSEISRKRDHVFKQKKVGSKIQYFSYKLTYLFLLNLTKYHTKITEKVNFFPYTLIGTSFCLDAIHWKCLWKILKVLTLQNIQCRSTMYCIVVL
jgi:hypothetical protein